MSPTVELLWCFSCVALLYCWNACKKSKSRFENCTS